MVQRLRRWYRRRRLQRLYEPISAAFTKNPVDTVFSYLPALEAALQRVSCDKAHYRARVRQVFSSQTSDFGSMVQLSGRVHQAMNSRSLDLSRYRVSTKKTGQTNLDQYLVDDAGIPVQEDHATHVLQRLVVEHTELLDRWRNVDPSYAEYAQQELLYLYIDWMGLGLALIEMELFLLQE